MSIKNDLKQARKIKTIKGHDIMALERFAEDTRHMIIFDVLTHDSEVGTNGERMRAFLSDEGYERAEGIEKRGDIQIVRRYSVRRGDLIYLPHKSKRENKQLELF